MATHGPQDLPPTCPPTGHGHDLRRSRGRPDRHEALAVGGYDTFRQVAFLGTFEGETQIGLGVRARLPFRVFTLTGPGAGSRLVVDVAHRWDPEPTAPPDPDPPASRNVKVFFSTGGGSDCGEVTAFFRDATGVIAPIRYALDQLVAGPTPAEEAQGAYSWFSSATAGSIRSINLRSDGLLIVDFRDVRSSIPGASASCGSEELLTNLTATVFRFAPVERVRFEINGYCDLFYNWLQRDCTVIERWPTVGGKGTGPLVGRMVEGLYPDRAVGV